MYSGHWFIVQLHFFQPHYLFREALGKAAMLFFQHHPDSHPYAYIHLHLSGANETQTAAAVLETEKFNKRFTTALTQKCNVIFQSGKRCEQIQIS